MISSSPIASKEFASLGFLVAGSDMRCHLFMYSYASRAFIDAPLAALLPELVDSRLHAPALCVTAAVTTRHRLIAIGFQNGRVLLSCSPLEGSSTDEKRNVAKLFRTDLDGPIMSLHLVVRQQTNAAAAVSNAALSALLSRVDEKLNDEEHSDEVH